MAIIKGVKEVVHLPLYDSIFIKPREQFGRTQSSNVLRFFQDVTGKTKLQTNMQAASLLPHWNTFEARALRVVISDLPPQFPDNDNLVIKLGFGVFYLDQSNNLVPVPDPDKPDEQKKVEIQNFRFTHFIDFTRRLEESDVTFFRLTQDDLLALELTLKDGESLEVGQFIVIDRAALKDAENRLGKNVIPPREQLFPHNGFGELIGRFIYNSVTTFFVGEKIMISVPTWFFPSGAGPYSEDGRVTTHGYPNPRATFSFSEPANVDSGQNFRVEIEIPENEVLSDLQRLYGPFFIWVVLDGFMTRDVQ